MEENNVNNQEGQLYVVGTRGYSAYEVAVLNGYTGTEEEWLESLVGPQGPQGVDGRSAYQVAVDNGYIGTEEEWVNDFMTPDGYYTKVQINNKIVDNLTTNDSTKMLSAKQGKILNDNLMLATESLQTLNTNIGSETTNRIATDNSLQTQIATERARIDGLSSLEEGSTTGDAELIDGRTADDGYVYSNIGGAIRGQIKTLNTYNFTYYPINADDFELGSISASNGVGSSSTKRIRTKSYIKVKKGSSIVGSSSLKFGLCKYSSRDVSTFIEGYSIDNTVQIVVDSDCYIKFVLKKADNSDIDEEDIPDVVASYSINLIVSNNDYTNDINNINSNILGINEQVYDTITLKDDDFVAKYLDSSGSLNNGSFAMSTQNYMHVKKGSYFIVDDGYRMRICEYITPATGASNLLQVVDIPNTGGTHIVDEDCYVRITLKKEKDSLTIPSNEYETMLTHINYLLITKTISEKITNSNLFYNLYNNISYLTFDISNPFVASQLSVTLPETYEDVYSLYDSLVENHSNIMSSEILGYTSENKPIKIYKIRQKKNNESDLPLKIITITNVHSFEKHNVLATYVFVNNLLNNWVNNSNLRTLLFNFHFDIIPICNPYGWDNTSRVNQEGVDLNRNFPIGWDELESGEGTVYYKGEEPLCIKETQILSDYLTTNKDDIYYFMDVHASSANDFWLGNDNANIKKFLKGCAYLLNSLLYNEFGYSTSKEFKVQTCTEGGLIRYVTSLGLPCNITEVGYISNDQPIRMRSFVASVIGNVLIQTAKNQISLLALNSLDK